jgi:hypothetical protein
LEQVMSDNDANPVLRRRDAAEDTGARRPPVWANDNAYPPGRDAIQRLAEKRIAEKRRTARRKQACCLTGQSPG